MLYSRAQVKLLLAFAGALLAGLAVREWRAGFPDIAERMERFDREESPAPAVPAEAPSRNAVAPGDPRPLDINRASVEQIARLPGVGPSLAGRIVAERERRGRFASPDALRHVFGMGPKKLASILELITVSD